MLEVYQTFYHSGFGEFIPVTVNDLFQSCKSCGLDTWHVTGVFNLNSITGLTFHREVKQLYANHIKFIIEKA